MDLSTKLPADDGGGGAARLVVGTLDVNVGAVLPAEELAGRRPEVRRQRPTVLASRS
jgi:hypothetical protein